MNESFIQDPLGQSFRVDGYPVASKKARGALESTEEMIQVLERLADNLPEPQRTEFAKTTIALRAQVKDLFVLGMGERMELLREDGQSHT